MAGPISPLREPSPLNCRLLQIIGGAIRVKCTSPNSFTDCLLKNICESIRKEEKFVFEKVCCHYCRLLIAFANRCDPGQDQQNVSPYLDPNSLTLW